MHGDMVTDILCVWVPGTQCSIPVQSRTQSCVLYVYLFTAVVSCEDELTAAVRGRCCIMHHVIGAKKQMLTLRGSEATLRCASS